MDITDLLKIIPEPVRHRDISFRPVDKPSRFNPKYFTAEGIATKYLRELGSAVRDSWKKISDAELKGLFVGGSQAEGLFKDSSDLDLVLYREGDWSSIESERAGLISQLDERYQILGDRRNGKSPGDVDFIITSTPFGRLYDLAQNTWVQGLAKHPKMYELQEHQHEIPFSFTHLKVDVGAMNQYFWERDRPATSFPVPTFPCDTLN